MSKMYNNDNVLNYLCIFRWVWFRASRLFKISAHRETLTPSANLTASDCLLSSNRRSCCQKSVRESQRAFRHGYTMELFVSSLSHINTTETSRRSLTQLFSSQFADVTRMAHSGRPAVKWEGSVIVNPTWLAVAVIPVHHWRLILDLMVANVKKL